MRNGRLSEPERSQGRLRFRNSRSERASSRSGQDTRDIELEYDFVPTEMEYPVWWSLHMLLQNFRELPQCTCWNCYICIMSLAGVVWVIVNVIVPLIDIVYNASYAVHALALLYSNFEGDGAGFSFWQIYRFLIDLLTFSHYVSSSRGFMIFCYYLRLHRPFQYLFSLIDFNLQGSVWGTTAKYCYIFIVLRITWAFIWIHLDEMEAQIETMQKVDRTLHQLVVQLSNQYDTVANKEPSTFLSALYLVNKMFIPIGPSVPPYNDIERVACLLVMLTGCLVVTGFAVASLSLVISLYMRPEETFRTRYKLIIKEMKESYIPLSQREKVETFYKMYWHKQKAVSATRLLPTFPPTLPAIIYTDIYFEATQRSRLLKDLTYQFLSEVAKNMETIHYIPGDAIIKRSSEKSSFIYITYGDIELVTPEDDLTAILRMTRGTGITPCGAATPAGFGRAHLQVRAATFCTAHVLRARDLWRVAVKYGRNNNQAAFILDSFSEHIERVKRHYRTKVSEETKQKSSILHFKRCLVALKEANNAEGTPLMCRTDFFLEIAGCYIMRNRADSSLTDEADAICLRPTFPCILQPTSTLQFAWNFFMAVLAVAVCFIHPYFLVFKKTVPIEFRFFNYMVTAINILDIIVHLSTGENVEEGVPITFAQTSSQQMKSPWFMVDLLATLPIFEYIGTGHFAGINKILKVAKVFRVLKELEDICVYRSNVLRFLSYTLLLMIACYLIAALQQCAMCFNFGYCLVTNLTHPPYWTKEALNDETLENRLTFGLYWAISMIMFTTHMETWGTQNWFNMLHTMLILEICIVLRIFMEAVYSATIMVTTSLREDYDGSISIVKNFLIRNEVDPILRQRFITYLQLCWFTDKAYAMTNKKSIFYDLPSHAYQDIVARQRSKYILCIPFMKYLNKEDLKNISTNARLFYTSPNEILMNTGDITNEIYVIKQGICEVICPVTKNAVHLLGVKTYFGNLVCLLSKFICVTGIPAYYTIRAVTHVQVFSISRKYLLQAIEVPHIKDAIEFIKQQPEYHRLTHWRSPFLSYVPPEPTPNMERFLLPRKHEQDHAFLQPFHRLGFFSILRYIFPRFTIRPDGRYILWYECFRAFCAFSSACVFPAYGYLVLQWPAIYYIAALLDISAYFDILQRMLVGYFNDQGILIYHPASTAAHYLKGAFITDIFGCVALESLESSHIKVGVKYQLCYIKQLLMLNRLIQLYRLPSAMHILHGVIERRDIRIVLRAIPMFIVLINVLTSFMVLFSVNIFYEVEGDWMIVPTDDVGGSWLELFKDKFRFNLTASPWNIHLASYFWVVYEATSTGYNIFNPSNFGLMRVLLIGMLIGAMLLTYFSVRIISIRANVNKALAEFQEHMKDIVDYMKRERLDPELQKDVLAYYEYNWDKMGGVDYRQVFKLCDQITLRTDAILHIYGPTFAKCPILSQSDASLLRTVGRAVRSAYFPRGMTIIETSDVIADMYFVDYGSVSVRDTIEDITTTFELSRGSVFGNLDGASTICSPVAVVATSKVHLLMINSKAFHQIIKDFPIVVQLMAKYRPTVGTNFIMSNAGDTLIPWKARRLSSPMIVRSRRGLIKFLFFKDTCVQIYLIVVSLLCVYADVYNAGFQDNRFGLIVALYALDLGFYLKILLQYLLPLIVDSDSIRNVLIPSRKKYFKGELKYDLLSCLPVEVLSLLSRQNQWMIFSWLRLNRMFRIVTVYKCLNRHQERITINLNISTVLSAFIWFTLFVHTISCLWYFIGVMEDHAEPNSSWIHKDNGELWCNSLYLCSLYFVLTTFIQNGVGDILPKKHSEVVFVCALQIISTMVYMIYVGEFSNIIQYMSFRSFSFYTQYLELQEFLHNNRVSKKLVKLVNRYCLHLWREARGMQAPHFLLTAPHALRHQIMSAAYMHHLTRHHVFEECEPAFLRQLVGFLQIYTYNEDMFVVKANEITNSMYLIHTGKVKEVSEISEVSKKASRIYPAGSYFGVSQGLFSDKPFKNTYQTLIKSQILTLRLDDWIFLLKHFPTSRETIKKHLEHDDGSNSQSQSRNNNWPYFSSKEQVTELLGRDSQPMPMTGYRSPTTVPFVPPTGPTRYSVSEIIRSKLRSDLWPKDSRHANSSFTSGRMSLTLDDENTMESTSQLTVQKSLSETGREADNEESTLFLNNATTKTKTLMGKETETMHAPSLHDSSESQRKILLDPEDEKASTSQIKPQYNSTSKSSDKAENLHEIRHSSTDRTSLDKKISNPSVSVLHPPVEISDEKNVETSTIRENEDEDEIATLDIKRSKPAVKFLKQAVERDENEQESSIVFEKEDDDEIVSLNIKILRPTVSEPKDYDENEQKTSTALKTGDEEKTAFLHIKRSKSITSILRQSTAEFDETEKETGVIDAQMQEDGEKIVKIMSSTDIPGKEDQATSTAKGSRRYIRVRYEEDDPGKEHSQTTQFEEVKPTKDLTITEQNILILDSDTDMNTTPEPEPDQSTSSTTLTSVSATSLEKKYNKPSS